MIASIEGGLSPSDAPRLTKELPRPVQQREIYYNRYTISIIEMTIGYDMMILTVGNLSRIPTGG